MAMTYTDDLPATMRRLQQWAGARPGNYKVDPYYFRFGMAHKPYWWDDYERRWRLLKFGDEFDFDENDIMVRINE